MTPSLFDWRGSSCTWWINSLSDHIYNSPVVHLYQAHPYLQIKSKVFWRCSDKNERVFLLLKNRNSHYFPSPRHDGMKQCNNSRARDERAHETRRVWMTTAVRLKHIQCSSFLLHHHSLSPPQRHTGAFFTLFTLFKIIRVVLVTNIN